MTYELQEVKRRTDEGVATSSRPSQSVPALLCPSGDTHRAELVTPEPKIPIERAVRRLHHAPWLWDRPTQEGRLVHPQGNRSNG